MTRKGAISTCTDTIADTAQWSFLVYGGSRRRGACKNYHFNTSLLPLCFCLHDFRTADKRLKYPELMIMGFISLGVFLLLQFGSVGSTLGFYTFEFAHIVIFFTTLIFVAQVGARGT